MLALFLTHWFEFNYSGQPGEPWYHAATWPNVFVIAITFSCGFVWSKTKFWPLRPIKHGLDRLHTKVDDFRREHREAHAALHAKLDAHADALTALADSHLDLHRKLDALKPTPEEGTK
jgi:hypothetical protein